MGTDPKKTLAALISGEPLDFPRDALERARALVTREDVDPGQAVGLPEPLALAVLESAVQRRRAGLVESMAQSADKSIAKAAKRSLYQLRSAGLAVEAPRTPEEPKPAAAPEEIPDSLLSAVTGTGERALILIRPVRGGLEAAHLLLSDEGGVLQLELRELSRGQWRRQMKEISALTPPVGMAVPFDEAKALLAEALTVAQGQSVPGLVQLVRHLELEPRLPAPIPAPEAGDASKRALSARLHAEPEFAQWLPSESDLQLLGQRTREVLTSPLALSDAQRKEQMRQAFRSAGHAFAQRHGALYARRLWAMAGYLERTGRSELAPVAAAEARLLAHGDLDSPFVEELFFKVMRMTDQLGPQMSQSQPGPLIQP